MIVFEPGSSEIGTDYAVNILALSKIGAFLVPSNKQILAESNSSTLK